MTGEKADGAGSHTIYELAANSLRPDISIAN